MHTRLLPAGTLHTYIFVQGIITARRAYLYIIILFAADGRIESYKHPGHCGNIKYI